jgi:hypothetical protein
MVTAAAAATPPYQKIVKDLEEVAVIVTVVAFEELEGLGEPRPKHKAASIIDDTML